MSSIGEIAKFRTSVQVNTINEFTSASGVTIDSVLLKDATVTASGVICNAAPVSLSNNAATTVYTITDAAGEAGKIEGRLQIAASGTGTSYTTWCGCSYSRQLNGTDYNIGGAFFDDSIPTGTVFSASGSAVQITLPNVANFSSASYRFTRYS
jgi:hypothetical protein